MIGLQVQLLVVPQLDSAGPAVKSEEKKRKIFEKKIQPPKGRLIYI